MADLSSHRRLALTTPTFTGSDDEMDILGDGSDVSQVSSHSAACADDVDAELTSHHSGDPDYNPMDSVTKDATGSGRGKSAQLSSSNKPKKPGRPRKKAVAQTGANGMEEGAGVLASGHLCAGLPQNQLKEVVEHPDSTMASKDCQTEQHPLPSTENRSVSHGVRSHSPKSASQITIPIHTMHLLPDGNAGASVASQYSIISCRIVGRTSGVMRMDGLFLDEPVFCQSKYTMLGHHFGCFLTGGVDGCHCKGPTKQHQLGLQPPGPRSSELT